MLLYCAENRRAPFVAVFQRTAEAHGFNVRVTTPAETPSSAYACFESAYRHLSVNSQHFEIACFRRYFAAQIDLAGERRFVISDSDIFVQAPWSDFPEAVRDSSQFVASVGQTPTGPEDDVSPHFSVWTPALLNDFIEFILCQYTERIDELEALHACRVATSARAAISDMTLLQLWRRARNVPMIDSNAVQPDGGYIDHNVSTLLASNARFREHIGRKQLSLRRGRWVYRTVDGDWVRPQILHLQGRYKLAAESMLAQRRTGLLALSAYIHLGRNVRRLAERFHGF